MGLPRSIATTAALAGLLVVGFGGGASAQSQAPDMGGGLANTEWLLGQVGTAPVPSGTGADLVFSHEYGGGFDGCNRFDATYTSDGISSLSFGPIATTRKACDAATMAFADGYRAELAKVASYVASADSLTLSDSSGGALLVYGPAVPASVEGPWIVTGYNNGANGLETPSAESGLSAAFGPEGTIEGFGGCNSFGGGYSVNGGAILIGPLMSTLMSCGDAQDLVQTQYMAALEAARTWAISSGKLELRDDADAMQVEFVSALGH